LSERKYDIICIVETWINNDDFQLKNSDYEIVHNKGIKNPQNKSSEITGRGVAFIYKREILITKSLEYP